MKAIIDRIEGDLAVLLMGDDGLSRVSVPLSLLPDGCREGDVLNVSIERNAEATQQARERVSGLMEKLKRKNQGTPGIIQD